MNYLQNVTGSESPTEERVHGKSIGRSNLTLKNVIIPCTTILLDTKTHTHILFLQGRSKNWKTNLKKGSQRDKNVHQNKILRHSEGTMFLKRNTIMKKILSINTNNCTRILWEARTLHYQPKIMACSLFHMYTC